MSLLSCGSNVAAANGAAITGGGTSAELDTATSDPSADIARSLVGSGSSRPRRCRRYDSYPRNDAIASVESSSQTRSLGAATSNSATRRVLRTSHTTTGWLKPSPRVTAATYSPDGDAVNVPGSVGSPSARMPRLSCRPKASIALISNEDESPNCGAGGSPGSNDVSPTSTTTRSSVSAPIDRMGSSFASSTAAPSVRGQISAPPSSSSPSRSPDRSSSSCTITAPAGTAIRDSTSPSVMRCTTTSPLAGSMPMSRSVASSTMSGADTG